MATSPLARGYGTVKPPPGTPLDRSHPLAQSLTGAWLLGEGAGGKVYDAADPGASGSLGTNTAWVAGESGPALGKTATSQGGVTLSPRASYVTASGSVVWRFLAASLFSTASEEMMWGQLQTSPTVIEFDAQKDTSKTLLVGWNVNGADRRVSVAASASNWVQGQWQTYALTWGPSGSVLYRNGAVLGTNATAPAPAAMNQPLTLLARSGSQNLSSGAALAYWYVYSRALTAAEVMSLYAAPYQMFLTGAPRYYSIASGLFLPPPLVIRGGFLGQSFGGL